MLKIQSVGELMLEVNDDLSKVDLTIEQEASNLANDIALRTHSIMKDEFRESSIAAKKDKSNPIITGVETDIVLEHKYANEGSAKIIIDNFKESLEVAGYSVTIKNRIELIIAHRSITVEVSMPSTILNAMRIKKKIKRIGSSQLNETPKVIPIHSVKKPLPQEVLLKQA
ncbi:MAG: hypothetical protein PHZ26_05985 [Candidatus Gracilibacteria bacterium]|nr:hypothetical protein [Candidatus Gracilibacteria bacterium]MDD2909263.1 hypothetical protein [Candidatus Gracilibacteria bacterium]